jgi:hypothetical protein
MKKIIVFIVSLFLTASVIAQTTQPTPPTKVTEPDGTIQLVPAAGQFVFTPYFIDPSIKWRLYMTTGASNKAWNGGVKNGSYLVKDQIIDVDIMAMPISTSKTLPDGKKVTMWSVYRSTDVVIEWDHTRLELLPFSASKQTTVDTKIMNISKTNYTLLSTPGTALLHGEALPVPEKRTPVAPPQYFQWNFDGYLWQMGYRKIGVLQFKVKDDYYLPVWGQQKAFIRVLPTTTVAETVYTTKMDVGPNAGTNNLTEIRSEGEDIMFGVPPTYKVSHLLSAPTTNFKVGDTVRVQIKVKAETKPQMVMSVATNLAWDPNLLELMSLDKTGAAPSMENAFPMPSANAINELAVPKDGTAWHNFLWKLGDKTYVSGETLIATLVFKVKTDFNKTNIEIIQKNDPRLVGLWVPEKSDIYGSSTPGISVLGVQSGVIINGTK